MIQEGVMTCKLVLPTYEIWGCRDMTTWIPNIETHNDMLTWIAKCQAHLNQTSTISV